MNNKSGEKNLPILYRDLFEEHQQYNYIIENQEENDQKSQKDDSISQLSQHNYPGENTPLSAASLFGQSQNNNSLNNS